MFDPDWFGDFLKKVTENNRHHAAFGLALISAGTGFLEQYVTFPVNGIDGWVMFAVAVAFLITGLVAVAKYLFFPPTKK